MAMITTGELYQEWKDINTKLENINNKVDQLSNRKVLEEIVVNAHQVRDTTSQTFDIDVSKFASINLSAYSDHDQNINLFVSLQRGIGTASTATHVYEDGAWHGVAETTLSQYINHNLNSRYKFLDNYQGGIIRITVRAYTQPTSGSLSILVTGVPV